MDHVGRRYGGEIKEEGYKMDVEEQIKILDEVEKLEAKEEGNKKMEMVQREERTQVDELGLNRRVAEIRGLCQFLGLGSWQEYHGEKSFEIGTGGRTLLKALYLGEVFGHDAWRLEYVAFYPADDPIAKLYPGVDNEISEIDSSALEGRALVEEQTQEMEAALKVLTSDKNIRAFLEANDPMALRQALRALGEPTVEIKPPNFEPRAVYFVMETQTNDEGEYQALIAKEGKTGYFLTDWYWGKDFKVATEIANKKNAELGIDRIEAMRIQLRTMRKQLQYLQRG
jgi:hypothetical protein